MHIGTKIVLSCPHARRVKSANSIIVDMLLLSFGGFNGGLTGLMGIKLAKDLEYQDETGCSGTVTPPCSLVQINDCVHSLSII